MTQRLTVDDLEFEVRFSSRRRTVEITVDRGGELILAAPPNAEPESLHAFVREKRYWIYSKLALKHQLQRPIPREEFIDGEGFLYLGQSYRLKLVAEQAAPLRLIGGRFHLRRELADSGRTEFIRWYSQRGREWLWAKAREFASRMEAEPTGVKVQGLGYRWGSCG